MADSPKKTEINLFDGLDMKWPAPTEEAIEAFQAQLAREKEIEENAVCPGCKRRSFHGFRCGCCRNTGKRPVMHGAAYWHSKCWTDYKEWEVAWLKMWTEIGWHAKVEMMATKTYEAHMNELKKQRGW